MENSKRFTTVVCIKRNEERNAVRCLSRYRQEHARNERKLAELRTFYEDYAACMTSSGAASTSIRNMNEYRRCLIRLHEAVKMQQQIVGESARRLQETGRQEQKW